MPTENERREALEALSGALGRVLEIGIGDLPPAARDLAAERVNDQGCRIRFTITMAPLQLECHLTSADLTSSVPLFQIVTATHGSAAAH